MNHRLRRSFDMRTTSFNSSMHVQRAREPRVSHSGWLAVNAFALLLLAFGGCVSVPRPLQGDFAALGPVVAIEHDATGQSIRWGGTIATVESLSGQTCFQLVGRPLNGEARPLASDRAEGRFIACRQGFYEPQVFAQGRSLTITGHVLGYETRKVGDYDYRQPKVAADVIYLWPERREVDVFIAPSPWRSW